METLKFKNRRQKMSELSSKKLIKTVVALPYEELILRKMF